MPIQPSKHLQSLPPYAFKEINDKVAALKAMHECGEATPSGERALMPIDFGVGDPSEPTPSFIIEGLEAAGRKHAASGYPSYIGSREFRQAAADYMQRRFGVSLDPETEISSNIGSKEAIFNFPEAFINPGDIVICPSPGYPPMKTGTIFAEGEPYFVPLLEKNGFMVDYASVPEDVARRTKIIWINYPNSPTGAVATHEYYMGLIKWAREHDIIIAADEGCYIDIYFGGDAAGDKGLSDVPISIFQTADLNALGREGIVAFYSMSKRNNMTGYRVGFVAGGKDMMDIFKKLKTNIDSGTPWIMQEAAILALKNDEHVAKMRSLYEQKADILIEGLRSIGLEAKKPAATFYIWQKIPAGMTDVEFAKKLLDPQIAIVVTPGSLISDECEVSGGGDDDGGSDDPMEYMGEGGGVHKINPGAGYVRFALMPTMEELKEAVKRLNVNHATFR